MDLEKSKIGHVDNLMEKFQMEFTKNLHELRIKRKLLEECRVQLTESILKQHEIEHAFICEQRRNSDNSYNNILIGNGIDALESERQNLVKELIFYKTRNDMITAERDSLYREARTQALENYKLKENIKDLEEKQQRHLLFQEEINEKIEKTNEALNTIMPTNEEIQIKQEKLLQINDNLKKFENLKQAVKQAENFTEIVKKERDFFENKYIAKSVECRQLHELFDNLFIQQNNQETRLTIHWKEYATNLQLQLNQEKERNEILEKSLRLAIENEKLSRKQEDESEIMTIK